MKTKIIVYVCLFLLLSMGLIYIAKRKPMQTGLSTGRRTYTDEREEGVGREANVLDRVAELYGLPIYDLEIINSARAEYPLIGRTVNDYKVIDTVDGNIHTVAIDRGGRVVDQKELETQEQEACFARYGRLEPALYEQLETVPQEEPIKAVIWLKIPYQTEWIKDIEPGPDATDEEIDEFFRRLSEERIENNRPFIVDFAHKLEELGVEYGTNELYPIVNIECTAEKIKELAYSDKYDEIDLIYKELEPAEPLLSLTRKTIGAHIPRNYSNYVYTGDGVKVGVVEFEKMFCGENHYLNMGKYKIEDGSFAIKTVCKPIKIGDGMEIPCVPPVYNFPTLHATYVAGVIKSCDIFKNAGIAPNVRLWVDFFLNYVPADSGSGYPKVMERAVKWGARVINCSYGWPSSVTQFASQVHDYIVYYDRRSVVCSAGDTGKSGGDYVFSPANGYNVIAVGAYIDRKWTHNAAKDPKNEWDYTDYKLFDPQKNESYYMSKKSSWKDPKSGHGDREKPELVAPGAHFAPNLSKSPWIGKGVLEGTSLAAPVVTGAIAMMIERNKQLGYKPEAVKAILMASAIDNIEGDKRLSEYDGAGGIRVDQAFNILNKDSGGWDDKHSIFWAKGKIVNRSIYLNSNCRTRIAVAWSTDPKYGGEKYYQSQPTTDCDLIVRDSSNNIVAKSSSWDNTYEIVDFIPQNDGFYIIEIISTRSATLPIYVAYAWWQEKKPLYVDTDFFPKAGTVQSEEMMIIPDDIAEVGSDYDNLYNRDAELRPSEEDDDLYDRDAELKPSEEDDDEDDDVRVPADELDVHRSDD